MKKTCLFALMMLVSAASVSAADNNADKNDNDNNNNKTAAADQKKKSNLDPNKVVCRTERATGSLTRASRVCHTRAEWDQIAQETNKSIHEIQKSSSVGVQGGNPLGG